MMNLDVILIQDCTEHYFYTLVQLQWFRSACEMCLFDLIVSKLSYPYPNFEELGNTPKVD
jgi:hypothetical protein